MELVIPTILLAINSNILYWKGQIINNHYEIIISPHGVLPKVREDIFQKKKKKDFMEDKRFFRKNLWGGYSKWET